MSDTVLDPKDIHVESYPDPSEYGFKVGMPKGVKITHKSGAIVICDTERSQHSNRDKAIRGLCAMLDVIQGG